MKLVASNSLPSSGFEHLPEPNKAVIAGLRVLLFGTAIVIGCPLLVQYICSGATQPSGWVLILGLLLSATINYRLKRDVLYPATAFSAVWFFASIVYVFFPFEIDQLNWATVSIFLGGNLSFAIGCALGCRPWGVGKVLFTRPPQTDHLRRLLLLYAFVMVPVVLYSTMQLAGVWSLSSALFITAREAIIARQAEGAAVFDSILVRTAPTVSVSTAFIAIMEEKNRWFLGAGVWSAIILSILTTGRPLLLLLACGWLMLSLLRKPDRSVKRMSRKLIGLSLLILASLSSVSLLSKKETQTEGSGGGSAVGVAVGMTACYIAGPLAGFNYVVQHPESFADSDNITFAQVLKPLSHLGFKYTPPPEYDAFLPVPFLINVFTAFKNYYVDFGVAGCFIAFFVFGLVSGGIFRAASRGNRIASFAFAYLFLAMVFTPFQDVYHSFGRYAYVFFFISSYYFTSRRLPGLRPFFKLSEKTDG